jgi:hypothetical protein
MPDLAAAVAQVVPVEPDRPVSQVRPERDSQAASPEPLLPMPLAALATQQPEAKPQWPEQLTPATAAVAGATSPERPQVQPEAAASW